jgi:Ca2+-binding RTX toxin-like protein
MRRETWLRAGKGTTMPIYGTPDADVIDLNDGVTSGGDTIYGYGGNDTIFGWLGNDTIQGNAGNDLLSGDDGADTLHGGNGQDRLVGGSGADTLNGGDDIDTADYQTSSVAVAVLLYIDDASGGEAEGDELNGIENVTGSAYADLLWGDDGVNVLRGMNGTDVLKGFGGNDSLFGGNGSDTLEGGDDNDLLYGDAGADDLRGQDGSDLLDGGGGADEMSGGAGNDLYFVDHANDVITESASQGSDEVRTTVSYTLTAGADVERLRTDTDAGAAPINLTGNASGNVVRGNAGANVINGRDGNDELTGLGGEDLFLFDTALDASFNVDVITDFNVVEDTIRLDATIFSSGFTTNNSVASSQFIVGTAALDAGHRILYDNASGDVFYDSDGTGPTDAIRFARLSAGLADPTDVDPLTNFDFFVVA